MARNPWPGQLYPLQEVKGQAEIRRLCAANRTRSRICASGEHVFAQQKAHIGFYIRTIGIKRAETKVILAKLAYNMKRLVFHEQRAATV